MFRFRLGIVAIATALGCVSLAPAARASTAAIIQQGVLNGAPYRIAVPANWNGTLLVYADFYRDKADNASETDNRAPRSTIPAMDAQRQPVDTEALLLSKGYALAGTPYRDNGWVVSQGMSDVTALEQYFESTFGKPRQRILIGASMGALIAQALDEQKSAPFDGSIAVGDIGAGESGLWDRWLAVGLAYDVAFGWPASWGTPGNARDARQTGDPNGGVDFESEVFPVVYNQVSNPDNKGRFEFIRRVTASPDKGFYDETDPGLPGLFVSMAFATEFTAEAQTRFGGRIEQNRGYVYTLTDADRSALRALGVDSDTLLAAMNARTNITADSTARAALLAAGELSGTPQRPVLTVKSLGDGITPPLHDCAYLAKVQSKGNQSMLTQAFVSQTTHVQLTPDQLVDSISAMVNWLASGKKPLTGGSMAALPTSAGFVQGFQPTCWPSDQ